MIIIYGDSEPESAQNDGSVERARRNYAAVVAVVHPSELARWGPRRYSHVK